MKIYELKYSKEECDNLVEKIFEKVDLDKCGYLKFTEFIVATMEKGYY